MGRRSAHTPEQLRNLIIGAARAIIESDGLAGLSAREVARRVGYSPGTIYNMFKNLDDVILNVELSVLDALHERLQAVLDDGGSKEKLLRLAQAYLAFTHEKPRLWNLLFEHYLPSGADVPDTYQQKCDSLMVCVEEALKPYFAAGNEAACNRAARVLWAGVHGITTLSTTNKLSNVTSDSAALLIDDLISTYLAGLAARDGATT